MYWIRSESDMQSLYEDFLHIDASYESTKVAGFVKNVLKRKRDQLFGFVTDRSVESMKNKVERSIRPIVAYRKVSGGSRSEMGSRDFARVNSVLQLNIKNGKLPFGTDPA